MIFLLDTNAFSDWMREHSMFAARLAAISPSDRIVTSAIVRGEILYGLTRLPPGKRKQLLEAKATALFAVIPCEPVTPLVASQYAYLKTAQEKRGLALDENDLWIAATAELLNATVVSRDRDMLKVAGLHVIDWTN